MSIASFKIAIKKAQACALLFHRLEQYLCKNLKKEEIHLI